MARWNYLFENGSKEDVASVLKTYQNDDGGFANALEPDCWNINSTPLQTWVATQIIKEINLDDSAVLVCNEEGKIQGLEANRRVGNDVIAGTFFIAGDDGSEYLISLTDEQIGHYTECFQEIEEISQEEVQNNFSYRIYGG